MSFAYILCKMAVSTFLFVASYLPICLFLSAALSPSTPLICGSEVTHTWALSISFHHCSLPANLLAVILRYIYVLGAEQWLAVTCVREVVALMEFYTWQPSRQWWYVFKILSRNKTRFCCLLGQVGLFLSPMAPRGPGDRTGSWWGSQKKVYPTTMLPPEGHQWKQIKRFLFLQCGGWRVCECVCAHALSGQNTGT